MSLERYREKRRFKETSEPEGKVPRKEGRRFVIQEHWASHHHFDFRLEIKGVLKSWAVPKGVPGKKGVKRLAIETEDHPIDYIDFSGEVPQGHYGAGKVEVFDSGKYRLKEESKEKIIFNLKGEKIKGNYALVKAREDNQWLLFKM